MHPAESTRPTQSTRDKRQPIAVLDSGVGGLPYLAATRSLLPNEQYLYVADRLNFPYGDRSIEALIPILETVVARIDERFAPKLLVLACNTASVLVLDHLRATFALPIVGVVPAIKPAAARSHSGRIAVLATSRTAAADYIERLRRDFAADSRVYPLAASDLVNLVEYRLHALPDATTAPEIVRVVRQLRRRRVDTIVLGCTHFVHLRAALQQATGRHVAIIDSCDGVAQRVVHLTSGQPDIVGTAGKHGNTLWISGTAPIETRFNIYAARFNLRVGGIL